jgi:cytochrome c peroxidase
LLLYDKQLSVNRNEACAFCHMPEAGFTGPVSELNRTTGSYPGSVRTRFSERKPQSHAYAPLSPVLHYNPGRGDLVGGNFWDMRATGRRLGNPAAEQAQGPPTNPVEMGLPDIAARSIARSGPIALLKAWAHVLRSRAEQRSRFAPSPGRRPQGSFRRWSSPLTAGGDEHFDQMAHPSLV